MNFKKVVVMILSVLAFLTVAACGDNAAERKAQQERENTAKSLKPVDKSVFDRVPAQPNNK